MSLRQAIDFPDGRGDVPDSTGNHGNDDDDDDDHSQVPVRQLIDRCCCSRWTDDEEQQCRDSSWSLRAGLGWTCTAPDPSSRPSGKSA
ncbi:hypothetical protein RHS02_08366, partial [Rhizoctonia solani]